MKLQKEVKAAAFLLVCIAIFLFLFLASAFASPGTINYYWNLTDTSNSADWLVIAYDDFYDNADLYRLAQFRAVNNSFNVGIVNLSDVVYQFNETAVDQLNDTAIKNFITFVYANWTKKERVNNDIFVLLVGDVAADGEIDYMPSHMSDLLDVASNMFLTDNWFADVNGSDRKQDVYIGRFSVKDNGNLSIIANKTLKYENETTVTQEWLKKMNFINGKDAGISFDNMNSTYNEIKTSYTNMFGFAYADIAPAYGSTSNDMTNNISVGSFITNYYGEGQPTYWAGSGGESFGCGQVPILNNNDNLTISFSFACFTMIFNWTSDVVGECMTKTDEKGAVAYFGATGSSGVTTDRWFAKRVFRGIFENSSDTLGEALKIAKDGQIDIGGSSDAELYNLLGDPALGIKDYRQPDFLSINSTDVFPTGSSAVIVWATDEASNSTVYYGISENTPSSAGQDDSVTLHTVTLSNLACNATYFFNVSSCDGNGNCNVSWQQSFTATPAGGCINYYWNLTDTSNSADWLVIAYDDFYDNADLYRLAQFRAVNNRFNVGIVNLSDVVYQFNETAVDQLNDTAIRNFIAYVYENWTKKERVNNDIFVLLVGDVAAEGEIDYMPPHMCDLLDYSDDMFLTDNWFADVNGSDRKPDVYIGRFSVKDNVNLSSIANKTLKYENETIATPAWLKTMNFITGASVGPTFDEIQETYNEIKSESTNQFGFYHEDIIPAYGATVDDVTNNISAGRFITNYFGEGQPTYWMASGFGCGQIPILTNDDNLTIIFSFGCDTMMYNWTSDSFGECATKENERGAVAFLGGTAATGSSSSQWFSKRVFRGIFQNNSATIGEALKIAKDHYIDTGGTNGARNAELINLLGDPALGIKDYRQPDISIAWPGNASVAVGDLNFSLVEASPDTCWYSNDSGVTNFSLAGCANTTLSLSDGMYSILLWANDTNGNENVSYTVDFLLDTVYPLVSVDFPGNSTADIPDLNFSLFEANPDSCWYSINSGVTNVSVAGCANTTLSISDGAYTLIFWANDTAGSENSSLVNFVLDANFPNISLSTPANGTTWTSSNSIDFSYAVSDFAIANCSLIINDVISGADDNVAVDASEGFSSVSLGNGAYTWSVNCTDNFNRENSSATYSLAVSYSAPPSSGGGGGGGTVVLSEATEETVTLATGGKAGDTKILAFSKDVGITEVGITLQNEVSKLSLTVEKLAEKPAETPVPAGKVYSYLKIDKDINDADISKAKIKFKVGKAWLAKNGFLAEEIVLKHYKGGAWENLKTEHLSSDADYHYYAADTKAFSYFAITAESKPKPPVETKQQPEPDGNPKEPAQSELLPEAGIQTLRASSFNKWLVYAAIAFPFLCGLIAMIILRHKDIRDEEKNKDKSVSPPKVEGS